MNEIVKVCKKHGELTQDLCYIRKHDYKECRLCIREKAKIKRIKYKEYNKKYFKEYNLKNPQRHKKYYDNNKELILKRQRERRKNNRKLFNLKVNNRRNKNRDKYNKYQNSYSKTIKCKSRKKSYIDSLSDNYIKDLLTSQNDFNYQDIPQIMIEFKRFSLMLKRKIRVMINEN